MTQVAGDAFPWGTLLVNALGCLALGLLVTLVSGKFPIGDIARTGLQVGLLGGFTTFSAFSLEVFQMAEDGLWMNGLIYIVGSLFLCVSALILGITLARQF
jgi:CrcB protein|tara:strand:+ start:901 stop:1203 length:303 start_codon:yes stop_codon:yes gene_type:complete